MKVALPSHRKKTNTSQPKVALFIGRFQPFHRGHLDALRQIATKATCIKIVVGSSNQKRTHDNPLSYTERKKYLRTILPAEQYTIYPVPDQPDDDVWFEKLNRIVGKYDMVYSSNAWVRQIMRDQKIPVRPLHFRINVHATDIRTMIRKNDRQYIKYLVHPLPRALMQAIVRT